VRAAACARPLEADAARVSGFSLHVSEAAEAHDKTHAGERCRHIARPVICDRRLSISAQGTAVRNQYPRWNVATHIAWDALQYIARRVALVPPSRTLDRHGSAARRKGGRATAQPRLNPSSAVRGCALVSACTAAKPRGA